MRFLLIAFIAFIPKIYAQDQEFSKLLELFREPKTEIPGTLANKYFEFTPSEGFDKLVTDQVVIRANNFIAVSTFSDCSAGGSCEVSRLTFFNYVGERIGKIDYERIMADCSFNDTRHSVIQSDSLLVFRETRERLDCLGDGRMTSKKVWLEFQPLAQNGKPKMSYTKIIALDREHYDASCRIFEASDLQGKSREELSIIRNEIFAAHGYIFKTEKWQDYFAPKSWYDPTQEDVVDKLSVIEKANIDLIRSLEIN
ncbi:YARHG domain-containing protein [Aquimarina sp. 2201CG5-10]|uniref:YARHG domain-containing protein n=1 Tax=Aquimarina callyspongiae TaxID=3098150 RepID=UPI002AB3F9E4|nr:YARHG domain-containing protein [Aquimarina sp. 2201CG5-10]MDY8137794.1 YARHG domain-containing protein [Aquimarina sp. 2201CG5-10]